MKKNKSIKRLLSLVIAITSLGTVMSLAACGPTNGGEATSEDNTTTEPVPAAEPLVIFSDGKMNFKIIIAAKASDAVIKSASDLAKNIERFTGVSCVYDIDALVKENDDAYEILIGSTDRAQSAKAIEGLKSKDYAMVIDGNKIVLNGPNDQTVTRAVEAFIDSVLLPQVASGQAGTLVMKPEDSRRSISNYRLKSCTILGADISKYSIVYPAAGPFSAKRTAILLSSYLSDKAGIALPVVSDKTAATEHEIIIGKTTRGGIEMSSGALGAYSAKVDGGKLCFGAVNLFGYMNLNNYFTDTLFVGEQVEIGADFTLSGEGAPEEEAKYVEHSGEYRVMFFNVLGGCDKTLYPHPQRNQTAAESLIALTPDVFGIQECSPDVRGGDSLITTLASAGYIEVSVTPNNSNKTNYTPLLYNKNKFKVIDCGYHLYDDGADDKSKSITWGVFEDLGNGKRFAVMSTHFAWKSDAEPSRIKDAEQILALNVQIKEKYNCPIISGGDLNCKVATVPYQNMLKGGMKDMQKLAKKADNLSSWHTYPEYDTTVGLYLKLFMPTSTYDNAIDHALLYNGDNVTVNIFKIMTLEYTLISADHCPVLVDFDISQ